MRPLATERPAQTPAQQVAAALRRLRKARSIHADARMARRGTAFAPAPPMKLSPLTLIALGGLVLAQGACNNDAASGDPTASTAEAIVEEVQDDGSIDDPITAADDDLGPDPEAMQSDADIEALAARPEAEQDAEAERELATIDLASDPGVSPATVQSAAAPAAAPAKAAAHCKKRLTVTFAVYNHLGAALGSNGCWTAESTVSDPDFRDCHVDGKVAHRSGKKWFYDDTNPYNDLGRERQLIRDCAAGEKRGYEYMAFREGRWRIVAQRHTSAYFAELYTDDAHIDDLWYQPGVYRQNHPLRRHKRVYPMLNFAPFPDGRYSQHQISKQILEVCKTVRNHGFIGLYEWHYSLPDGSPRLLGMAHALNLCTRR
jgi:hypothetical protein